MNLSSLSEERSEKLIFIHPLIQLMIPYQFHQVNTIFVEMRMIGEEKITNSNAT